VIVRTSQGDVLVWQALAVGDLVVFRGRRSIPWRDERAVDVAKVEGLSPFKVRVVNNTAYDSKVGKVFWVWDMELVAPVLKVTQGLKALAEEQL